MPECCRSCKAPVRWALTPKGERAPIDVAPSEEKGNTLLLAPSGLQTGGSGVLVLAVVLSGDVLRLARDRGAQLHTNHWVTCPDRAEWREKTDAKKNGRKDA